MWRLSFSRDGRLLATVSKGGQLRIWDVSSLPAQPTLVASLECADPQMEPTDDDGENLHPHKPPPPQSHPTPPLTHPSLKPNSPLAQPLTHP